MGVETGGGPSEEDLKIRPGEPEGRLQDVDQTHRRAKLSEHFREISEEKVQNAESAERYHDSYRKAIAAAPETDDPGRDHKLKTKQDLKYEFAKSEEQAEKARSEAKRMMSTVEQVEEGGWDSQMNPGFKHDWVDTKGKRPPEPPEGL
ncbi:MAG: hypothetical protein NTY30_03645 [Candidatus Berkelbacteria bacterium]|nr:hypothetical protein [Candidatus Berkelbacteria bacterium]